MYFSLNDIKNLTEERINDLMNNQIPESKTLDYKEQLPDYSYEHKKEFLADVSSFSNADGGNLIFGVKEDKGIPVEITGVEVEDLDKEKQRFENLIRDCIEPRIQGIIITPFKLQNGKYIFIFYIPKSFNSPHVVKINTHWRFYSRNSAEKYSLEVSELRSIITLSSSIRERIRDFRLERISQIKNRDLPVIISDDPKFIYHLIPLSSFATDFSIDLAKFEHSNIKAQLFYDLIKIYNYEGILIHNADKERNASWYAQVFRNGIIEVCNNQLHNSQDKTIERDIFESEPIEKIPRWISVLNFFDIQLPIIFFYSILDIHGYKIKLNEYETMRKRQNRSFLTNDLLMAEVLIDDNAINNLPLTFKPLFDPIWNAAGHPQSPNYNDKGEWKIKN